MSEREAAGSFDYVWEEPAPDPDGFDAFAPDTWVFKPAPPPWYRTRRAVIALVAAGVAAAAIVVSAVLLLLRDTTADETPAPRPASTPSSAAPPSPSSAVPPSPSLRVGVPPAPPPTREAPGSPVYQPTQQPRPTKKPEIGVTRTPVTRSPLSVAPQPRPRN